MTSANAALRAAVHDALTARVARLAARAEAHDIGAPLRPARALQRDIERKQHFMKCWS